MKVDTWQSPSPLRLERIAAASRSFINPHTSSLRSLLTYSMLPEQPSETSWRKRRDIAQSNCRFSKASQGQGLSQHQCFENTAFLACVFLETCRLSLIVQLMHIVQRCQSDKRLFNRNEHQQWYTESAAEVFINWPETSAEKAILVFNSNWTITITE